MAKRPLNVSGQYGNALRLRTLGRRKRGDGADVSGPGSGGRERRSNTDRTVYRSICRLSLKGLTDAVVPCPLVLLELTFDEVEAEDAQLKPL